MTAATCSLPQVDGGTSQRCEGENVSLLDFTVTYYWFWFVQADLFTRFVFVLFLTNELSSTQADQIHTRNTQ